MSMCRVFSCVVGRGCLLWPVHSLGRTLLAFVLRPTSFCTPRPKLPVTPDVSWLPTFAFQSPIMKRTSFLGVSFRSITTNEASGGDGIPGELFQILKDDAVKVLQSICQQNWKTQQWPQDWKRSVFIPIPKKGNARECSNYHTIALISHASKVMLKIL